MHRKPKLRQDSRPKCTHLRLHKNWAVGEVVHCNSRGTQEICIKFLSVIDTAYQGSCQASGETNRNKHAHTRRCSLIQLGRRCPARGVCIIIFQQINTHPRYRSRSQMQHNEQLILPCNKVVKFVVCRLPMHAASGPLDEASTTTMQRRSWYGATKKIICESSPCRWAVT
jgi:hypothetical protein